VDYVRFPSNRCAEGAITSRGLCPAQRHDLAGRRHRHCSPAPMPTRWLN